MKKLSTTIFGLFAMALLFQNTLLAQDVKAEVKGEDVGNWFSQNWLWVAGAVVLLLLIFLFSGSSRRARTTTTTSNRNGHVTRTTTTEEVED